MNELFYVENSKNKILENCKKMLNQEIDYLSGCLEVHKNVLNICEKNQYPNDIFNSIR